MLGALARHATGVALPHQPGDWAWSTLAVNALGAALLCALLTRAPGPRLRLLLGTGVLGAFTTFSGLTVDAVLIADGGRPLMALLYVLAGLGTLVLAGLAGRAAAAR